MGQKLIKRLGLSLVTLFLISLISFALMQMAPGGPMAVYAENPKITKADRARIAHRLGLDKPKHIQYLIWMKNMSQGDFGNSYKTGRPVLTEITERIPATLKLMLLASLISIGIAIPIGIYSATHRNSLVEYLLTMGSFFGLSMPTFWFGLILIYIFALTLQWLPAGGYLTPWFSAEDFSPWVRPFAVFWEHFRFMIMPALVLGLANTASWSRYMRSSMLEIINQDYIRTARAKGVNERSIIFKHALRNALPPIVTVLALDLPVLFGGAIVTEKIFAWPGMGRLFIDSVFTRDYQIVMGITVITAILVIISNFLADIIYSILDPRVKYES